jgi:ethanolaminephosphotransferase
MIYIFSMCPKITEDDLVALKNYKYQSTPPTPLEILVNPFEFYCANKLPMWMAPNLITLIGFMFALLGNTAMITESIGMSSAIPSWALFFHALCTFIYQTLDELDGKQARRTGSSSILGQLFDHGCDAFLLPFDAMNIMQLLKKGSNIWSTIWIISVLLYYFIMTWEEYNIGLLPTGAGIFGSKECIPFD